MERLSWKTKIVTLDLFLYIDFILNVVTSFNHLHHLLQLHHHDHHLHSHYQHNDGLIILGHTDPNEADVACDRVISLVARRDTDHFPPTNDSDRLPQRLPSRRVGGNWQGRGQAWVARRTLLTRSSFQKLDVAVCEMPVTAMFWIRIILLCPGIFPLFLWLQVKGQQMRRGQMSVNAQSRLGVDKRERKEE